MRPSGSEIEFWCSSSLRSEEDENSESCEVRSKCVQTGFSAKGRQIGSEARATGSCTELTNVFPQRALPFFIPFNELLLFPGFGHQFLGWRDVTEPCEQDQKQQERH